MEDWLEKLPGSTAAPRGLAKQVYSFAMQSVLEDRQQGMVLGEQ
jgi:hypothetical protein